MGRGYPVIGWMLKHVNVRGVEDGLQSFHLGTMLRMLYAVEVRGRAEVLNAGGQELYGAMEV